ncbi:zf-HC2 domain-containing protein [Pedococcus sp. KACC 23699]|uniref:Zf-HC2 domain-containing protein n=1 Tax=Pedococcus sp. KACC 23699 TaxID=3149228 RepID=A0AAU7JXE3_9MICO
MNDTDQYAEWDAAYVLGALSGDDRAQYEEHLAGCARCRAAVGELAGLPGLLGQLSPAEAIALESGSGAVEGAGGPFADPLVVPEPPASLMPLLPSVLAERRRRWLAPLAAAAAALLIGGVGGYAVSASRGAAPGAPPATVALGPSRLAFTAVAPSPMTAVVDVVPTGAGTELRVECQYAATSGTASSAGTSAPGATASGAPRRGTGDGGYTGVRYAIWVVGKDGREMEVKDWTARSGRIMHPSGVTPWRTSQIAAVEIRLADTDTPVMRALVV